MNIKKLSGTLLYISFIFLPILAVGQNNFEGIIEFKLSSEDPAESNPNGSLIFYIGDQDLSVRIRMKDDKQAETNILFRNSDHAIYLITDSTRVAIKLDLTQIGSGDVTGEVPDEYKKAYEHAIENIKERSDSIKMNLINTGQTMVIAGYSCTKFQMKGENELSGSNIWLTKEIKINLPSIFNSESGPLSGFFTNEGFPLRIENKSIHNGVNQKMVASAVKIKHEKLDPKIFQVPENYKIEDLRNLFGK